MNTISLLGLFCGLTVAFCLFLSTYFLLVRKENQLTTRLLGVIFLAVSLRISKSIWFFILYDVGPFGLMMGYIGLSLIGPTLYLYIRKTQRNNSLSIIDGIHVIVPVIGIFISLFSGIRIVTIAYKTTTVLMMIYLAVAWLIHLKNDYNSKKLRSWSHHVLIAISLVWASFVYQHITETILDYAVGGGLASIPIYYLLIVIIKNPNVFVKAEKIDIPNDVILKIQKAFEIENIFLNRDLNLTQFASTQEIPAYLVTKTVNHLYGKTFPETVNYFRVNEIKNKLAKNTEEFVKIEWLAYDSGFKTTSTFYTAFKKETGMTPKAFQRQHRAQTTI